MFTLLNVRDFLYQKHSTHHLWSKPLAFYLFVRGLPDVEHFSSEGEHAVAVSSDHPQPRHGERLGRVSLSKDQCAADGVFPTCFETQLTLDRCHLTLCLKKQKTRV